MSELIFRQYEAMFEDKPDTFDTFAIQQIMGEAIVCCAFNKVIKGDSRDVDSNLQSND